MVAPWYLWGFIQDLNPLNLKTLQHRAFGSLLEYIPDIFLDESREGGPSIVKVLAKSPLPPWAESAHDLISSNCRIKRDKLFNMKKLIDHWSFILDVSITEMALS